MATTRGRVVARELAVLGEIQEGRWGKGGSYRPKVTYTYAVDGVTYACDRSTYGHRGLCKSLAEQALAAIPDAIEVHHDPSAPEEAYLEKHTPRLGHVLVVSGAVGVLIALVALFG